MAHNNDQIWNALMEIKTDIGEIKGTQKAILVHSHNTDQHLNRLNERTTSNEVTGAENKTSINRLYWIIGGICSLAAIATPIVVVVI